MQKYGGCRHHRDCSMDAGPCSRGHLHMTRQHLALAVAADQGDWGLAFLLSLVREPSINVHGEAAAVSCCSPADVRPVGSSLMGGDIDCLLEGDGSCHETKTKASIQELRFPEEKAEIPRALPL